LPTDEAAVVNFDHHFRRKVVVVVGAVHLVFGVHVPLQDAHAPHHRVTNLAAEQALVAPLHCRAGLQVALVYGLVDPGVRVIKCSLFDTDAVAIWAELFGLWQRSSNVQHLTGLYSKGWSSV
jgi:hypothetical protein